MKVNSKRKSIIAASLAVGSLIASATAATITVHGGGTITTDYSGDGDVANLDSEGAVGSNGSSRIFYQVNSYNVATLMSDAGISDLSELSGLTFTYEGVTTAGTTLAAGTYSVHFVGIYSDDVPTSGVYNLATPGNKGSSDWTDYQQAGEDLFDNLTESTFDTAIADLDASQAISGTFNISSLATDLAGDGDLSDDYVMFAITYSNTTTAQQGFDSTSLTSQAIPEPSSAALLGFAGMSLLLRRNRKA